MNFELSVIVKILIFAFLSFGIAFLATPLLTHFLYKYKLWKPKARDFAPDGRPTPILSSLHNKKEVGTPRMGGLLIWLVSGLIIFLGYLVSSLSPDYSFWN